MTSLELLSRTFNILIPNITDAYGKTAPKYYLPFSKIQKPTSTSSLSFRMEERDDKPGSIQVQNITKSNVMDAVSGCEVFWKLQSEIYISMKQQKRHSLCECL